MDSPLTTGQFVEKIRELLTVDMLPNDARQYLDLSRVHKISEENIKSPWIPPPLGPLHDVFSLMLQALQQENLDKIHLGINEILKAYLEQINDQNQTDLTESYFTRINWIFLYTLKSQFPYAQVTWQYISRCLHPVGFFLLDTGNIRALKVFLDFTAEMGKTAAKQGLRTDSLQQLLRKIEVDARQQGWAEVAGHAKTHRENLEI